MIVLSRADARKQRQPRYFTGRPCKNGHLAYRAVVSGTCVACVQAWKVRNAAVINQRRKEYRARAAREIASYRAAYYQRTGEHQRAMARDRAKAWNAANPELHRAKVAAWKAANPEMARANGRAYASRRKARLRKVGGSFSAKDIADLMKRQRGKCVVCTADIQQRYQIDHVVPLKLGGTNSKENLQLLCPTCNNLKGAKHPAVFMQERGFLL